MVGKVLMKLTVTTQMKPINLLGVCEIEDHMVEREVFLDGKRAPKTLEHIILRGLDEEMNKYVSDVEALRKRLEQGE